MPRSPGLRLLLLAWPRRRGPRRAGWLALACAFALGAPSLAAADESAAPVVKEGAKVGISYTLKLADGTVADSNEGRDPLVYEQGKGQILPALEKSLVGLKVGDTKHVSLTAEQGYGPVRKDLYKTVPIDQVPEDARKVGTALMATDDQGNHIPLRVHEVRDKEIVLDLNHPLAGKALEFDVKVVSIE